MMDGEQTGGGTPTTPAKTKTKRPTAAQQVAALKRQVTALEGTIVEVRDSKEQLGSRLAAVEAKLNTAVPKQISAAVQAAADPIVQAALEQSAKFVASNSGRIFRSGAIQTVHAAGAMAVHGVRATVRGTGRVVTWPVRALGRLRPHRAKPATATA
jgi:2',3'-cyclic-nucleotide 2'-phosphodiesterase (5'-nucleotidase family)